MSSYTVRTLQPDDHAAIMALEQRIFGDEPPGVLGPYYVRLCCDQFADCCFVALCDGVPVAYLLSFVRDREAHCTTLAVVPEHQGSRAVVTLIRAFLARIIGQVDICWFTVTPDNTAARALHATLGAREVATHLHYYASGDRRLVSCIDAERFGALRPRYERLGLLEPRPRLLEAAPCV